MKSDGGKATKVLTDPVILRAMALARGWAAIRALAPSHWDWVGDPCGGVLRLDECLEIRRSEGRFRRDSFVMNGERARAYMEGRIWPA